MFTEMRTTGLLQKALHGPEVLTARRVLRMATIDGAKAIGLENDIGSLQVGKRADVIVIKLNSLHSSPQSSDVVSALVYSAQPADVQSVVIDGKLVMRDRELLSINEESLLTEAGREAELLINRAGVGN
jgi:cytosine/adenosine deaminase-related metal-dependent hydrolase